MIIKANRHSNGGKLAAYLMDGGRHGERVFSPELHGFEEADNIFDAFRDIEVLAGATKAEYPFLHVQIRLAAEDEISRDQWKDTADRVQARLGLTGQPRADVYHVDEKTGKMHLHLAISLIDEQTLKAKPLPYFKLRLKALARELEKEFDITRVNNHRDGAIKYGATKAEEQQAQRLGFDKEAVRNTIRHCWDASDCGRSFDAALADAGLILAKGDRGHGNFLVIDPKGGLHVLGKRILDASAAQVRERLADLDRNNLPTVAQARELMLDMPRDRMDRLTRELADVQKQIQAEREYAQRDQAREEIAWQDALATAAIEKEKAEGKFIERPTPSGPARQKETRPGDREKDEEQAPSPAPELGKTQAEIRLARNLSPGPQSFANALEDRGFILTHVTDDDIQKDLAKLREQWEERRRNPQSWMEHEGGYDALPKEFQGSARRSFDEWQARNRRDQPPRQRQAKPFTPDEYLTRVQKTWAENLRQDRPAAETDEYKKQLKNYVDFVQKKWAEGPQSQLERAMGALAVVTPFGSVFTLTPRNTGLSAEELPHYLDGTNRAPLLSVTAAQAVMEDVQKHRRGEWQHRHEEWLMQQPLGATAAGIRLAYASTQTGPQFAAAIEDRGLIMACVNEADAERLNRWERQRLKERGAAAPAKETTPRRKERDLDSHNRYQAGEFVVVNQYGSVFQLTAATTGAHAAEREARLNQIDRAPLMSVTAAQSAMREYQQHRQQEREENYRHSRNEKLSPTAPPRPQHQSPGIFAEAGHEASRDARTEELHGPAAKVWEAWRQTDRDEIVAAALKRKSVSFKPPSKEVFAAALDRHGISFARATKEEADQSYRKAAFARETGNYAPRFKEGEIVLITEPGLEYRRDGQITTPQRVHQIDKSLAAKFVRILDIGDRLQGIHASLKASDKRAQQRGAGREAIREIYADSGEHRRRSMVAQKSIRNAAATTKDVIHTSAAAVRKTVGVASSLGKTLDVIGGVVESLAAPPVTPERKHAADKAKYVREAEADDQIEFSRYDGHQAQQRHNRENEQASRDRQRENERGR